PETVNKSGLSHQSAAAEPAPEVTEEDITLANLYRDAVIEHAVVPVGYRQQIAVTHRHELYNPLCGDRVEIQFQVVQDKILAAAFDGEACAICTASASMLCAAAPLGTTGDICQQHELLVAALKDKQSKPGLESLQALLAVRRYPARVRCALLPWEAAIKALFGSS
ncbi:MAG TPA: iron-sulfur cluster assembly scaffold protein, partial [Xanthomonadales bacterium]|nr:iron-sulfur cluster assembly scaffold protein [Xanthomonadales bacterium]